MESKMNQPVSDQELLQRCYSATHEAADKVSEVWSAQPPDLKKITALRNKLREAYCAVQELKLRAQQQRKEIKHGIKHDNSSEHRNSNSAARV
jgi:hypothetical protein